MARKVALRALWLRRWRRGCAQALLKSRWILIVSLLANVLLLVVQEQRKLVARARKSSPRTLIFLQSLLSVNRINFASLPPDVAEQM